MKTETQQLKDGRDITATLCWLEQLADEYIARGDRAECDKAGKNLAAMTTAPEWAGMANGLAAILDKFRADYRAAFAAAPAPAPAAQLALPKLELPQGTFTVSFPDGDYRTVELETVAEGGLAGKTIASYLSGPDNERDFNGFAFITERGQVALWKKHAGIDVRWVAAVNIVLNADAAAQLGFAEAYAERSGRCARCGRKLTVPASLHRGYGPDCAAKLGLI
jgi:hypothetical protein